jgi:prepilin-type N-terminal cleavage/methylation domain-containing protein/prepilin-type processing-associated H-X9-DG protein
MKPDPFRHAAFTIIELLIVISVISLLAALLFPVISQARKYSQISVCTANLHQLGQGIAMYTADWDGGMPFAPDPLLKYAVGNKTYFTDPILHLTAVIPYDVRTLLAPYGCEPRLYCCPLDSNFLYPLEPGHKPTFFEECGSSYWYDDQHALRGFKLGDYPTPATNVIMSDYTHDHPGNGPEIDADTQGTVNLLFADLHVKSTSWQNRTDYINQIL